MPAHWKAETGPRASGCRFQGFPQLPLDHWWVGLIYDTAGFSVLAVLKLYWTPGSCECIPRLLTDGHVVSQSWVHLLVSGFWSQNLWLETLAVPGLVYGLSGGWGWDPGVSRARASPLAGRTASQGNWLQESQDNACAPVYGPRFWALLRIGLCSGVAVGSRVS